MKKYFIAAALAGVILPLAAQETYENANIATEDLNGTARYVGMGGAMEALGADISTIASNPAGIGLFRHSTVSASGGLISQEEADNFDFGKKTKLSFDQIGFVYAIPSNRTSFFNVGFNYHKSRNFSHILKAADNLSGASQGKLSFAKGYEGVFYPDKNSNDEVIGYAAETGDNASYAFSQIDYLYYNALLLDKDGMYYYDEASNYLMNKANKGYIGEYDFNISGNINNRVYLGLTLGFKDVNYKNYSEYTEQYPGKGAVLIADDRRIDGSGFDVKAGIIFRPVETSPFRIGLYVHTPTWYDLNTSNYTTLTNGTTVGLYDNGRSEESYDFKIYTPWKFGVSLGHTVGKNLALGATYEYADYSSIDTRINTGTSYNYYYDSYVEDSESDTPMNNHTSTTLRGVSTLKLGAEYKPDTDISVRFGYNYVSPMYKSEGDKNGSILSPGSYYASATDYTNWKATHRITCGLGYNIDKLSLDLAYQYNTQEGDFRPFMPYYAGNGSEMTDNVARAVTVSNKRHQLLFTLGYHF